MTGYTDTCEIMNDSAEVVSEVSRDLRGLHSVLHSLAQSGEDSKLAEAIELAAQQALLMHRALSVASEYVTAIVEREAEGC